MKKYHIKNMTKGWFVGDFNPTVLQTSACEVAIKEYAAGETETKHYHKIAKEITVVISGKVEMCGEIFSKGDIVALEPGEETAFRAITDAVNVIVKMPSVANDKFLSETD